MTRATRSILRLWLPLVIGLMAGYGLLLTVRPAAVAGPPQEQPAGDNILWLVPPEIPPASGSWPLAAEARQTDWRAQSAVVVERLVALKAQGHIGGFASLAGGAGFAVTAPDGLPPEIHRWPEVARVTAPDEATPESLAAWWRQGLDAASATRPAPLGVQQATTLTLNLGLYSYLASGSTPRPENIALRLTRNGEVIAEATTYPFPDGNGGYLYAAMLYSTRYYGSGGGGYCYPLIESGDILQAIQAGQIVSLTVPLLSALADQHTKSVYGQAPPTATLEIYFYRYSDPTVVYRQTITATAAGNYQADFSSLTPVTPRDYGYVFHANASGNHVYARYNVPFLLAGVETHNAGGVIAPCTPFSATLRDGAENLRVYYYGFSSSDGTFNAYFYPPSQVNDTLVVTAAGQVISLTIPALTARPDPAGDIISGEAPAGAAVQVDLYRGPLGYDDNSKPPAGEPTYSFSVTATTTGTYTADFTGLADVVAGEYGAVYVTNVAGHQAYRRFAVPFLQTRLGNYQLTGQVNGGSQVTVTVWGSCGIPRGVRFVPVYDNGYFTDRDLEGGLQLLAGDQVTVTAEDGQETGLLAPVLTATADQVHSTVHGQAPPNSPLRVEVSHYWYPGGLHEAGGGYFYAHTLWVTSTATGVYTADFSSLTTFQQGNGGRVFYINPAGHEVYVEFSVPTKPFMRVQSGSNYVSGALPVRSKQIAVTLRDAGGQVKATATTKSSYDGYFTVHLYQSGQPAIITAGDTVEVSAEGVLITVTVPTLTVQADRAADVISGQAPPSVPLKVTWSNSDSWYWDYHTWTVTSTAAGAYTLNLSGEVDLERGNKLDVMYTNEDGHQIMVTNCIPRLKAGLGSNQVSVLGPVYAPLTLTLLNTEGAPLYVTTATLNKFGYAKVYLYGAAAPVYLETGQTLVANLADEVMTLTLPHLTAWADPVANTISGMAPPGARLIVYAYNEYYWGNYSPVTATVTGTYRVDFSGVMDIGRDNRGEVIYLHPDGHRVTLDYAVPHVEVTLGESHISGVAAMPGVVTVTLHDAGGIFKGSGVGTVSYNNAFNVYLITAQQQPVTVSGGDEIIIETTERMTYTVSALTVAYDRQTGILSGTAPARTWLYISVRNKSRQIQAGPDGTYAMDWSDLSPHPGERGSVVCSDKLGNQTRLYFTIPYYNIYLPLVGKDG
jgi:hypothetical protein